MPTIAELTERLELAEARVTLLTQRVEDMACLCDKRHMGQGQINETLLDAVSTWGDRLEEICQSE